MKDGQPLMTFGNMGGSVQPETHAQHMVNLIDHGMNVQMTTDAARFTHNQSVERAVARDEPVQSGRRGAEGARGTTCARSTAASVGGYQGILFTRDPRAAGADLRSHAASPRTCRSTASIAPDPIIARTVRRSGW